MGEIPWVVWVAVLGSWLYALVKWGWKGWKAGAWGLRERRLLKDREEWYAALQRGEHGDSYEEWQARGQEVRTRRGRKRWYEP